MRLSTTQRGLGYRHQSARRAALAAMRDGDPCSKCGGPMYRGQKLELDHLIPRAYGGTDGPVALAHQYCNRRAGAVLGNKSPKRRRPRPFTTSRRW